MRLLHRVRRHREIYPSDRGATGFDYASASPTASEYAVESSCRSTVFQRTANSVLTICVSRGDKRSIARN